MQTGGEDCRDQTDHVVAHILEANDDAGGAVYGNLRLESCEDADKPGEFHAVLLLLCDDELGEVIVGAVRVTV